MVNLRSDCTPEPAEGIFWHPGPPDGRILMPAAVVVAGGFPSPAQMQGVKDGHDR
jgi:hypothetical protein